MRERPPTVGYGFSVAAIAKQLAEGTIKEHGVVNGEHVVNLRMLERSISDRDGIEVEAVLWPSSD